MKYHHTVKRRQEAPELMVAFTAGVTIASAADRPYDCLCQWAPEFAGVPGDYQVTGRLRLKFVNRWCPHAHARRPCSPVTEISDNREAR